MIAGAGAGIGSRESGVGNSLLTTFLSSVFCPLSSVPCPPNPVPRRSHPLIHIRSARHGDAGDVAALFGVLGYPCTPDEALARMRAVAAEADQALLVAERGGMLCGLLALDAMYYLPLGARTCRITALVVTPAHQGEGIGHENLVADVSLEIKGPARQQGFLGRLHIHQRHMGAQRCQFVAVLMESRPVPPAAGNLLSSAVTPKLSHPADNSWMDKR
mgnify:CR=1 FL=1